MQAMDTQQHGAHTAQSAASVDPLAERSPLRTHVSAKVHASLLARSLAPSLASALRPSPPPLAPCLHRRSANSYTASCTLFRSLPPVRTSALPIRLPVQLLWIMGGSVVALVAFCILQYCATLPSAGPFSMLSSDRQLPTARADTSPDGRRSAAAAAIGSVLARYTAPVTAAGFRFAAWPGACRMLLPQ
jgi:hypothetical protein